MRWFAQRLLPRCRLANKFLRDANCVRCHQAQTIRDTPNPNTARDTGIGLDMR